METVSVGSSRKRKTFQVSKYTKRCSNHFEHSRPVDVAPILTLFLKGYDDDAKIGVKRKAPKSRATSQKENIEDRTSLETKKSQPVKERIHCITHFLHFHQAEWKNQLFQHLLMFLGYLVKLEMSTLIYQKPNQKS